MTSADGEAQTYPYVAVPHSEPAISLPFWQAEM